MFQKYPQRYLQFGILSRFLKFLFLNKTASFRIMVCTTLPRICYLNYITNSKLHAIFRTADVFYFPTFITVNNTTYVTLLNLVARTVVQMSHVTLGILESFVTIIAISFITIDYYTLCIANNTTHHTSCCAIHRMFCISTIRFLAVESILFY